MNLTLKQAMQTTPLRAAEVVAGFDALDVIIRETNIMEVPEVSKWMKGGELLFSSGYAFEGDADKGCRLIESLKERGISALAIKPGKYLREIPQKMKDYADHIHFPLLKLPEDRPYMDYMEPIYELLLNQKVTTLEKVTKFHETLLKAQISGGLMDICRTFAKFSGCDVFLSQTDGQTFSAAAGDEKNSLFSQENRPDFLQWLKNQMPDGPIYHSRRLERTVRGEKQIFLCLPLLVKSQYDGYFLINESAGELNAVANAALNYTVTLISLEILNEQAMREEEQQVRGELLDDLLRQAYEDEELIYRRSQFLHFDLTQPFALFMLGVHKREDADLQEPDAQSRIKSDLLHALSRQFRSSRKNLMLLGKSSGIVGLCSLSKPSDWIGIRSIMSAVIEHIRKTAPAFFIFAGFGRVYTKLDQVPASYSEAMLAERVGRRMYPEKPFVSFEELGVSRILYELRGSRALQDFYHENLDPLLLYDRENSGTLIDTLSCYFRNRGNLRKTAEDLFVHKNSVIYRIKKIESLLKKDLQNVDEALNLQLCLKIHEFFK